MAAPLEPLLRQPPLRQRLRVAVVGAGIGGTALAHWLREMYGDDVDLTVISDGPVGGRCQSLEAPDGQFYEGGAAIISELNEYMVGFMQRFGLSEKYFKGLSIPLGIFDGEKLLVRDVDPLQAPLGIQKLARVGSALRFLRRYGFANLRQLKSVMKHSGAPEFPKLYQALREGKAYTTPEELLEALGPGCSSLTREAASTWLTRALPGGGGLPDNLVRELVTGGMRANYGGQGCDALHAFVGLVSVAGGVASRCFAVRGGNEQVPKRLLEAARPNRILTGTTARRVRRVKSDAAGLWEVVVERGAPAQAMKGRGSPEPHGPTHVEGPFDVVVLAHPSERSCVHLEGSSVEAFDGCPVDRKPFRRCVTHFVQGVLRRSYFEPTSADGERGSPPMQVLTVSGSTAPFYSIGLQLPTDIETEDEAQRLLNGALHGDSAVFKIFAGEELTEAQLDAIFERREGKTRLVDWYAYPKYEVPQVLKPFVLDDEGDGSLLYLNAIEQAASALEMSAVSARNAANLVARFVERRRLSVGNAKSQGRSKL